MPRRFRCAPLVVVVGATFSSAAARAGDAKERDECIAAAESAQQVRDEGKYRVAREGFARCARDTCPAVVRQDCTQWLEQIDETMPTVSLRAQDASGNDLTHVVVSIDGAPFATVLDGKPAAVDPGEHVLRFETAGAPPVEERVVIAAGEKNRPITVHFRAPPPALAAAPPALAPSRSSRAVEAPPVAASPGPPLATWVLGGVAAAAFGSEAYFGLTGLTRRSADLGPGGCAPRCSPSEKSDIEARFLAADVSLGVGLVSAGFAVYAYLASRRPAAAPPQASVGFAPRPGGGIAAVLGRF